MVSSRTGISTTNSMLLLVLAMLVGISISTAAAATTIDECCVVLDMKDMVESPPPEKLNETIACEQSVWCEFRPNLNKYILSGAADTEHVSILWYPITDGSVGLHYHSKAESVYTISGTQADAKGVYPTGYFYINPVGSGHSVWDSSGFFLLAYAAPPDFDNTDLIDYNYTPVIIDTNMATGNITASTSQVVDNGHQELEVGIDAADGMSASFFMIDDDASSSMVTYKGNYIVVLEGTCMINGETFGEQMLVVAKGIPVTTFEITNVAGSPCNFLGSSFTTEAAVGVAVVDDADANENEPEDTSAAPAALLFRAAWMVAGAVAVAVAI